MPSVVTPLIEFRFPFPHALSPDHEAAGAASVRWAHEMGLATSEFARTRLAMWKWGRLTGHCVPTARGADLNLIAQWMTFGFLYDDQFNGILGERPDLTLRVTEDMISVLHGETGGTPRHAAQRALTDLLRRLAMIMSENWLARFRDHMRDYFTGVLHQTMYRLDFRSLTHSDALDLRRANIAMQPLIDLIEVAEHVEVPAALLATPHLSELRRIVVDTVIYQNDVFSLPKDRHQREVNAVLAIQHGETLTEQQALAKVESIIAAQTQRFLRVKSELPTLVRALGVTSPDRAKLDRYVHCLELMIHGCVYSHAECVRYAADSTHTRPLNGKGYLEDLHLEASVNPESTLFTTPSR